MIEWVCPVPRSWNRSWTTAAVIIVLFLLFPGTVFGQWAASAIRTGAPPAWVDSTVLDSSSSGAGSQQETAGGESYRLMDTQINAATSQTYFHVVKEITSDAGVQSGANLRFSWDPSYQELIVHQITIRRGADKLDRLDPARFKVIQQESDLNMQIYNGTLSALLFLDDVRVGDEIEYSYTLKGENPSLKGKFTFSTLLGWGIPMEHQRIRLLWPENRQLKMAVHGTEVKAEEYQRPGMRIYVWDLRDTPPISAEDNLPKWYSPYPWLQLSEFKSWSDVGNWAAGLYETTNLDAPELKGEIAILQQPGLMPREAIQNAVDFVQNDIRYLGIEFGPNSYRPTDPVTVLQRRFGDCKDKSFLLCALLRGMGYDATPVLIATGFSKSLPDLLPAPEDFNHVIVRLYLYGETFYLDPTRFHTRGPIDRRYLPSYDYCLPITSEATDLTPIPLSSRGSPYGLTSEYFKVGGQKGITKLEASITYTGADAEWIRAVLDADGRTRVAESYMEDYARRYPGIAATMPMAVMDSTNSDMVKLVQHYSISNFWVLSADKEKYNCSFYPLAIRSWLTRPSMTVRSMPLNISFPRERIVQTTIELPFVFALSNSTDTITGPAGRLHVEHRFEGKIVHLTYDYQTLTNCVPASLVPEYLTSINRMEDALPYGLKWLNKEKISETSQFNWPIFLVMVFYAVCLTAGIVVFLRYQFNKVKESQSGEPPIISEISGLGGWLILVIIGLFLGPVRLIMGIVEDAHGVALWKWHQLTTPGGISYNPMWGPALIYELLGQITILIMAIFAIILFFQKRRLFPRWFILMLVLNAIFVLGDTVGIHFLDLASEKIAQRVTQNIISVFIGCIIWIPYMCLSKRVKGTFLR